MTSRERQVFDLIREDPMISQEDLAAKLGISRSAVSVYISSLLRQGALRGRGYVVNEADYYAVIGTAGIDFLGDIAGEFSDSVSSSIINYYGQISYKYGGAAFNICENLTQLGENTRLISPMGGDIFGRQITEYCKEHRINTDDCLYLPNAPQGIMLQMRNAETGISSSLINYRSEAEMTPAFFTPKHKMLDNAHSVILTDVVPLESAEHLLTTLSPEHIWLILSGVTSRIDRLAPLLPLAGHIYLNLFAAARVTGSSAADAPEQVGKRLQALGIKEAFVSCGNRALLWVTPSSCVCFPTPPGTNSDSERGKDAFAAGLLSTADNPDLKWRIAFSSAVCRMVTTSQSPLTREAAEQAMGENFPHHPPKGALYEKP